eukprot:s3685_g1.t1
MAQTLSHGDFSLLEGVRRESMLPRKFTVQEMDAKLRNAKYAVRGAVPQRAAELKDKLKAGEKMPFDRLVFCNIGNPHAVQQKPITFYRQALAVQGLGFCGASESQDMSCEAHIFA